MAIVVFWSLSILLVVAFSFTRRRLHLFEGIVQWCFLLCLQNNFIWLMCLNLKLVELSQNLLNYWAYDSIRSVIVPLLMIYFLELNDGLNSVWTKAICWAGIIGLFVGIEYLAELLEILHHRADWKVWWSIANWTANVLLSFALYKLIRSIARKEVNI